MIQQARKTGHATESKMWQSIESVAKLLQQVKEAHPQLYWDFLREQYGILYNRHYGEEFAEYDVAQMQHTCNGKPHQGAHWTVAQVEEATSGLKFPSDVTKWDKYVAFNAQAADLCGTLTQEQIIQSAYKFYFCDEDWEEGNGGYSPTKIWDYMAARTKL